MTILYNSNKVLGFKVILRAVTYLKEPNNTKQKKRIKLEKTSIKFKSNYICA